MIGRETEELFDGMPSSLGLRFDFIVSTVLDNDDFGKPTSPMISDSPWIGGL
jgi:hypothetical protein